MPVGDAGEGGGERRQPPPRRLAPKHVCAPPQPPPPPTHPPPPPPHPPPTITTTTTAHPPTHSPTHPPTHPPTRRPCAQTAYERAGSDSDGEKAAAADCRPLYKGYTGPVYEPPALCGPVYEQPALCGPVYEQPAPATPGHNGMQHQPPGRPATPAVRTAGPAGRRPLGRPGRPGLEEQRVAGGGGDFQRSGRPIPLSGRQGQAGSEAADAARCRRAEEGGNCGWRCGGERTGARTRGGGRERNRAQCGGSADARRWRPDVARVAAFIGGGAPTSLTGAAGGAAREGRREGGGAPWVSAE